MIATERLLLRQWRDADREAYAALNADPIVMQHFPSLMTRAESDTAIDRNIASIAAHGWGNFAVERRMDGVLLGHIGVKPTEPALPFDGTPEAGWRLARHAWGQGYASEGARAVLTYGLETLGLREILSFTTRANVASQAVMRRISMVRDPARDFDHPALPRGHRLERHMLYAARRSSEPSARAVD